MSTPVTMEQAQRMIAAHDEQMLLNLAATGALDFTMLRLKLRAEHGWTVETCEEAEGLYRKFLALHMRYPDRTICPTGPIDAIWHAHILDTRAYAADCQRLFGRLLEHYPYFGLRGPDDERALQRAFEESMLLFVQHFGIDPSMGDTKARSCRPQNCP